jgi:hypothetical protein
MSSLTLIVPGLSLAVSRDEVALPSLPALERLLSRGSLRNTAQGSVEETLCGRFAVEPQQDGPPVAPLTLLADGGEPGDGWWLRADPVHLMADRDRLLLFESHAFSLPAEEAERLVAGFNRDFSGHGWRLHAPRPERWYLCLDRAPDIRTHPITGVAGRDLLQFLPRGEEASAWHRFLNEAQMHLHMSTVNLEREGRGEFPVNSIWPWGGGRLPETGRAPWDRVRADDPLARGLAKRAGLAVGPQPGRAGPVDGDELWVLENARGAGLYGDPGAWVQALEELERDFFAPLLAALRAGALRRLDIDDGEGRCWSLTPLLLRRFWRKVGPLHCLLRD